MIKFFLSLKTSVWILTALVCFFFVGSYLMPLHRDVFGPMNDDILFQWTKHIAVNHGGYTWWFFAAVAGLILLTINTLVCSIAAVRGKWSRDGFLLRISPQIVHAGFLFILLGHLLGAAGGYRISGLMPEGAYAPLPDDLSLRLHRIRVETDARGFMTDWSADVSIYEGNDPVKTGSLGPNAPVFYAGIGVYLKSLDTSRGPAAVLLITKDPGALYALAGGILFMFGMIILLFLKWSGNRSAANSSSAATYREHTSS